jgi:hypothetical protein
MGRNRWRRETYAPWTNFACVEGASMHRYELFRSQRG